MSAFVSFLISFSISPSVCLLSFLFFFLSYSFFFDSLSFPVSTLYFVITVMNDFFDVLTIESNRCCPIVNSIVIQEAIDDQQRITIATVPFFHYYFISISYYFISFWYVPCSVCVSSSSSYLVAVVFLVFVDKCWWRFRLNVTFSSVSGSASAVSGPDPDLIDHRLLLTAGRKKASILHVSISSTLIDPPPLTQMKGENRTLHHKQLNIHLAPTSPDQFARTAPPSRFLSLFLFFPPPTRCVRLITALLTATYTTDWYAMKMTRQPVYCNSRPRTRVMVEPSAPVNARINYRAHTGNIKAKSVHHNIAISIIPRIISFSFFLHLSIYLSIYLSFSLFRQPVSGSTR